MQFPPSVLLATTLKAGTVYLMDDDIFDNDLPHFVVILNKNIKLDNTLYLVVATSKVEKKREYVKRRSISVETLVETNPTECSFLNKLTVFDCNRILERTLDSIIEKVDNGDIKAVYSVTDELLGRIRDAVKKSPLVEKRIIKSLV